jgi:hypothetical protein
LQQRLAHIIIARVVRESPMQRAAPVPPLRDGRGSEVEGSADLYRSNLMQSLKLVPAPQVNSETPYSMLVVIRALQSGGNLILTDTRPSMGLPPCACDRCPQARCSRCG